jgi:hypothetical protein
MKTEFVIERGWSVRLASALGELWTYRAIIVAFVERNIRVKYTAGRTRLGGDPVYGPADQASPAEPHASPVAHVFDGSRLADRVCTSLASGYRPCEGDNLGVMP